MNTPAVNTPIRITPLRLFFWFGAFIYMVTAPLGCGGCAHGETKAYAAAAQEPSTAPLPAWKLSP